MNDLLRLANESHKQKLRVWWVPQLPMKPFFVYIVSIEEGVLIIDTLAKYDLFQLHNNIKPDYCNDGGIEYFNENSGEWEDWEIEVDGEWFDDPEDYIEYLEKKNHERPTTSSE